MAPSDNLLHHDRNAMAVVAGLVDAAAFGLNFLGLLGLSTGGQRTLRRRALLVDTAIVALATGFVAWELEQLAHLRELGCDEFQGFLAARPMPYESVHPEQSARLTASTAT